MARLVLPTQSREDAVCMPISTRGRTDACVRCSAGTQHPPSHQHGVCSRGVQSLDGPLTGMVDFIAAACIPCVVHAARVALEAALNIKIDHHRCVLDCLV